MDLNINLWKLFIENGPFGILLTSNDYRVNYISSSALSQLGYQSQDPLIGKLINEISNFDSAILELKDLGLSIADTKLEIDFVCEDKSTLTTSVIVSPIERYLTSGNGLIWCFWDIEKQSKTINLLQSRLLESEAENNSKTYFLASISHSIRSHLNSIVGLYQLLYDKSLKIEIPYEIKQFLNGIELSIEQLQSLVGSFLDLNTIDKGGVRSVETISFHTEQMMQSLINLYKAKASEKSLWFTYEIDEAVPHHICADRKILIQILSNLIDNAIKYTKKGNAVNILVCLNNGQIEFRVKDEGVGIQEHILPHIFNLHEMVGYGIGKDDIKPGLGLTIVSKLTPLINGSVYAISSPGRGSTFVLQIPLIEGTRDKTEMSVIKNPKHLFSSDNRILIIEDDKMNREVYKAWFEEFKFKISFACNGDEGIQIAKTFKPNLIILDIYLPGLDGISTIELLRKNPLHRDTPIIVVSVSTLTDKKLAALDAGCNEYLTKPADFNHLISILNKYLIKETDSDKIKNEDRPTLKLSKSDSKKAVNHCLNLTNLPIFHLDKLIAEISEIKQIFATVGYEDDDLIDHLESAAFEGNDYELQQLIDKAKEFIEISTI